MAQAPYITNDKDRNVAIALAECGVHRDLIARQLHISPVTLVKYYGEEMDAARHERVRVVANALYENAVLRHNVIAQMFFLKTQGRWKEEKEEVIDKPDILKELSDKLPD